MRKLVAIVLLGLSLSACGTSGPSDAEVYAQAVAPMNDATFALAQAMKREDLPEVRTMADRAAEEASNFLDVLNNTNWSGDAARHARELSDLIAHEIILLRSLAKSDDENIAFAAEDFATVYQESRRMSADLVLGYCTERLIPSQGSCVIVSELVQDFNAWVSNRNHHVMAERTVVERFANHEYFLNARATRKRTRDLSGVSRPWEDSDRNTQCPTQATVFTGVRFRKLIDDLAPVTASEG